MQTIYLSDSILVKQYIKGKEHSLEVLINRHKNRIYRLIYSKINDKQTTEDIFQDTFIRVINTLKTDKYHDEGKFLPWVLRIASNLVINYFRKNNRIIKFRDTDGYDIVSRFEDKSLDIEEQEAKEKVY